MATIKRDDNTAQDLISAAQNFTGAWADLGGTIDVRDVTSLGLLLKLDINDALNARIRMVAVDGSDIYTMPILDVTTTVVNVAPEYYEFINDSDQNIALDFTVLDVINTVKFQISAGTAGASPGQIDSAKVIHKTVEE